DCDAAADTPDHVQRENEHGPVERSAEGGNVSVVEEALSGIVGIEQRLRGKPFLDDGVRECEQHDRRPSAPRATRDLTHEEGAAAVLRDERDEECELSHAEIAEQEFGNERREYEKYKPGRDPAQRAHVAYVECNVRLRPRRTRRISRTAVWCPGSGGGLLR